MSNNELVEKRFLPPATQELHTDLDYARKNLYDLIETGQAAMVEISDIAQRSQNATVYKTFFEALGKMGELNQRLIDISNKKKEVQDDDPAKETGNVTNNNLILTTTQLQDLLANMQKEQKENDQPK
jgi:hypothetical protein